MFDIRTAWRRLTAKISGSTDQEIIDTTEAEDSSGTTAPASVTPPATLAAADVDDAPATAPPVPTPSEETVADDPSATRPTRVISLGEVWVDIMMDVDSLPESGGFAASRSTIPTIDGSYRALLASRLMGTPTAHAGIIGAGPWASMIRHAFYEHDITHIGPDRLDADTGFRLVLNDTNGGKTFIATYGAEAQGGADTFDGIDLQPGDVVSISSNSLMDATAAGVDAFIRQAGSDPDARPYQIVLSPTSSLERVNNRLLEDLVLARPIWTCNRQAAVKLANRLGAPLDVPGGEVTHVDGFPTKAVHKRSAGTVHTGVLCAMLATGRSLVEATQVANAAASLSIEHSENGIPVPPARDEVLALVEHGATSEH